MPNAFNSVPQVGYDTNWWIATEFSSSSIEGEKETV